MPKLSNLLEKELQQCYQFFYFPFWSLISRHYFSLLAQPTNNSLQNQSGILTIYCQFISLDIEIFKKIEFFVNKSKSWQQTIIILDKHVNYAIVLFSLTIWKVGISKFLGILLSIYVINNFHANWSIIHHWNKCRMFMQL